jgi:hypothetical protein
MVESVGRALYGDVIFKTPIFDKTIALGKFRIR